MACDGDYLYIYSEYGFHKIGTGFGGTVSGHQYVKVARTSSNSLHSSDVCLGFYQVINCLFKLYITICLLLILCIILLCF